MIPHTYLKTARSVFRHLEQTQLPHIEAAAALVVHALHNSRHVWCSELGHGIQGDFVGRAGGLVALHAYKPTAIKPTSGKGTAGGPTATTPDADLEEVRRGVRASELRAGDVILVSSVSGRNRRPVELALACREAGLHVVAFTALAYAEKVTSLHPSGKRLHEVADLVIDLGAPYGDAAVNVPGYEHPLIPVSGLGMLVAGWMLWGRVMELAAEKGEPASVLISQNRDGGPEHNEKSRERYRKIGF